MRAHNNRTQNKRTFYKRTINFPNELGPSGESQITSSLTYGLNSVFHRTGLQAKYDLET